MLQTTDKRIDIYIEKAADFAKPILIHLRELIHKACPQVEETWKWSFPNFDYKGPFCSMAAFKQHCAFNFWKASLMQDPEKILQTKERGAMGNFDRITSLKDLPSDKIMLAYIKEAVRLNDEGIKKPAPKKSATPKTIETPADLQVLLNKNKKAKETFDAFAYSHKKEYIEWITEAKTEVTRTKRLETTIQQLNEGLSRHHKYQK